MDAVADRERHVDIRRRQRVERVIPDRRDPLLFDDEVLFQRYRFRRPTLIFLFRLLGPELERPTGRNGALSVPLVVLTALHFFATGAFFHVVGRSMDMLGKAAGLCVHAVAMALQNVSGRFLVWSDMQRTQAAFTRIGG